MHINFNNRLYQKGISLIELVIFIVILSVALTGITLIYINTTRYSADPMVRIRSIELAQSTLEEILLKAYDESTPVGGGCVRFPAGNSRCLTASSPIASSLTAILLKDEEGDATPANPTIRAQFDDVDDYNNLAYCGTGATADSACTNACIPMVNESGNILDEFGNNIANQYSGFSVCIIVNFSPPIGGPSEIDDVVINTGSKNDVFYNDAKRIDVIVTDPLNSKINLSAYRLNY